MKKIMKTLIILIIIALFILITFSKFADQKAAMENNIGNVWTGGPISTVNYATITKIYSKYLEFIKNEEYENAYKMLSYAYTEFKDYDTFISEINTYNYKNAYIEEIIRRTDYVYSIILNSDDVKKENLLIFNNENTHCTIRPETFLEHNLINEIIKKKKVEYELIDTVNYIDKFVVNIKITNLNKKDIVKISNIKLVNGGENINSNLNVISLNPEETKTLTVEFETYIDFPSRLEITRYIEKKDSKESYMFNLE